LTSMNKNPWILPDGVEEILPDQAWKIESLRRQLLDNYREAGYELIIPPLVEFTDSLFTGVGADLDLLTFKMIDQISGKTLGLRSDMSPQAARIDAHSLANEGVNRLCYAGSTLKTLPTGSDVTRSPLQVGAEIFGDDSAAADVEILLMMLSSLKTAGIEEITIDFGHVGVFAWLEKQITDQGEDSQLLFDLIQGKRIPEIKAWVGQSSCSDQIKSLVTEFPQLAGDLSVLDRARQIFAEVDTVLQIVDQIQSLVETLQREFSEVNLFLDLAEIRGSNYHSGLVFAAYAPGYGSSIANGGRYDQVGAAFGRARPATGFSTDLKALVQAGNTVI
jgi:ATP phosphoribosyltransferase regulatory subunit